MTKVFRVLHFLVNTGDFARLVGIWYDLPVGLEYLNIRPSWGFDQIIGQYTHDTHEGGAKLPKNHDQTPDTPRYEEFDPFTRLVQIVL